MERLDILISIDVELEKKKEIVYAAVKDLYGVRIAGRLRSAGGGCLLGWVLVHNRYRVLN